MSVRTMARVWEFSRNRGNDLLMLLAIADFSDDDGNAYPSVQTLAEKCRMKSRNANVILAALRKTGELEIRQNEGPHGTNRYRVVLPALSLQESTGVQKHAGMQKHALTPAKTCSKPLHEFADEPSVNHQEPSTPPPSPSQETPAGLDLDSWNRWSAYRKDIRKAIKPASVLAAQRKLAGFGADQAAVVEQSIANGWQGLFALKAEAQANGPVGGVSAPRMQPGATRIRGGIQEHFTETMGWVPA